MKTLFTFLLPLLLLFCGNLVASPIDSLQASKVATNFIIRYVEKYEGLEFMHKEATVDNAVMYYVFNLKNAEGYVIVVADNACFPILAYSTESKFEVKNMPIQLNKWLWHRAKEIAYIRKRGFEADDEIRQAWKNLEKPSAVARTERTEGVNPLMTTKWNQSPFYNDLCPRDSRASADDGNRTVTGCVATAIAQIMKYHNHPQKGQGIYSYTHPKYGRLSADFGSTTYNWANMPNKVTSKNLTVATLMYHCGVSLAMDYGISEDGGSGTSGAIVVNPALTKYFGYATSIKTAQRKNYSEANWIILLKRELDAKRPMYYEGLGGGSGHAFVCDGYDDNNFFHFNWGWGELGDGYYSIRALNPKSLGTGSGLGEYNSGQAVVIGIQPAANSTTNLQLNKKITVSPSPIGFGDDVKVSFNIVNRGTSQFSGDYAVALFNKDFEFVSFIGTTLTNRTLNANSTYTNDLSFTQKSVFLSEGEYYIAAYYREPQKEWQLLAQSNFENPVKVAVSNIVADLSMYGTPIKVSTDPIFQTRPFEVTFNVANFKSTTFEGDLSLDLYDLEGNFVKEIENKTSLSLGANKTFTNPLIFKTNGLNIPLGTYILAPSYRKKGSASYTVLEAYKDSKGIYPNLILVVVAAPPLVADKFEINNQESQASTLPITFTNNLAVVNTESSNLHIGTDIDHYRLNLPSGYDYEITARLHDKHNSGNGKTYTVDALFSYKIGTGSYSDAFDVSIDENNSKISINSGGTVIFKVAPYFSGFTGTYLLDIQVNRKQITSSDGYCASCSDPNLKDQEDMIKRVQFANLDNSYTATCANYSISNAQLATVYAGTEENLIVTLGTCSSKSYPNFIKIFADWNADADFNDNGEYIAYTNKSVSNEAVNWKITIPNTATPNKLTWIRVVARTKLDGETDQQAIDKIAPCGTYPYGETEDHPIIIRTSVPLSATISASGSTIFCKGGNVSLSMNNASSLTNATFQWLRNGQNITGAAQNTYNVTESGNYSLQVSANGQSITSNAIAVTVNEPPTKPTLTVSKTEFCEKEILVAQAPKGFEMYEWQGQITTSDNYTGTHAVGSYYFQIRVRQNGCWSALSDNLNFRVNPLPNASFTQVKLDGDKNPTLVSSSSTGNQWYLNNNPIAGANSQTYRTTEIGNYSLRVTQNNCTAEAQPVYVLGNEESAWENQIQVFPNPTSGEIQLVLPKNGVFQTLKITNLLGQKILEKNISDEKTSLDLSAYPQGVYYLQLSSDRQSVTKKIVLAK